MRIHPGRNDPREVVIRFRAPSRDAAIAALEKMGRAIPDGYCLQEEHVIRARARDGSSNGRKVAVTLVIYHNDSRIPAIGEQGILFLFQPFEPGQ